MKTCKVWVIFIIMAVCLFISAETFAEQITATFNRTSDYSRIDFGNAYIMVWSGHVVYNGMAVGQFNASTTKTTLTGIYGDVVEYDVALLGPGIPGEFISIRTIRSDIGDVAMGQGMIYAASPYFKFLVGAEVVMNMNVVTITY